MNVIAIRDQQPSNLRPWREMEPERKALLKQVCSSANLNDAQFELLVEVAIRSDLDPFRREIYGLFFDRNFTIVTGIDGFRRIASRHGLVAMDDTVFTYDEKNAESKTYPLTATVTVYKLLQDGTRGAFTATARWREYARFFNDREKGRTLQSNWRDKPHIMLSKCAEALAIRKGFAGPTSGIYERAEFGLSDGERERSARVIETAPTTVDEILAKADEPIDVDIVTPPTGDPRDADAP